MKIKKITKLGRAGEVFNLRIKTQSDANHNYFANGINVANCHKSRGNVIKKVIEYCINWRYMLGLSGTVKLDEKYSDYFRMLETIGPLVLTLSAKHLIDNQYSPNIKIKQIKLAYDKDSEYLKKYWDLKANGASMYSNKRDFGGDMFELEKQFLYNNPERLSFINELVRRLNKNTLVLFSNIKDEYGKKIYEEISKWNKHTFYIDGEVDNDLREQYKAIMEAEDNVVIVASFGTFSTGIDIKKVYHIIFAESTKAEITIRQSIGRGMRAFKNKLATYIWDIVDMLDGYMVKHSKARLKIYKEQKFEVSNMDVDLTKFNKPN